MKHSLRRISAGVLLAAGVPVAAMAQTTTTAPVNVNVTASVSAVCSLSATTSDIGFGAVPAFTASAVNASGSVSMTCNRGAVVSLAVGDGNNFGLGVPATRAMKSGTSDYMSYQVFQPNISGTTTNCTGASTAWSSSSVFTATTLFSGSGGPRTILLCGQVAAAPAAGYAAGATYADIVAVTATYQ